MFKDSDRVVVTSGSLTAEMIENASKMALERHGTIPPPIRIPEKMFNALIEWQKLEKWFKSLGAHKEKIERLRYRLKNRVPDLKVLNLPE
jgi:hypothetical protein